MKRHFKFVLVIGLLLVTTLFVCACSGDRSPYSRYDEEGYNVSVKFDANGGAFADNVYVMTDVYNVSKMDKDQEGNVSIPLLSPSDELRGKSPTRQGYFLVGWYVEKTEDPAGEGDLYSDRWDFDTRRLKVDADAEHHSAEPVLTLYAVWAPMLEVEIYDVPRNENGDPGDPVLMDTIYYNPIEDDAPVMPHWHKDKGTMVMEDFPKKEGYTFNGGYLDEALTRPITSKTIEPPYQIDFETGHVSDTSIKVYVDWREGEWYRIDTAKQLRNNASLTGNYEIVADLDFAKATWPSLFMHSEFTGTFVGLQKEDGTYPVLSNIEIEQNHSGSYTGLFGCVAEGAKIKDLTFDNVNYYVKGGQIDANAKIGLFAGEIASEAEVENVQIRNSVLKIGYGCLIKTEGYKFGLVCGEGYEYAGIDHSGITCEAVSESPEGKLEYREVTITADGNELVVKIETKTAGETP